MQDQSLINQLKGLIIDGVHYAQSGHPGGALSSIDFTYILAREYLRFDPDDPKWLGRDRLVLSAGHESMLLYAFLYAFGWLDKEELKRFRQLGSKTPGHPEYGLTPGVECTTGPLGQGAAMSVGMAIGQKHLEASLDQDLFSNFTWSILGDGCMQEGVTYGSASLAAHLKLGKLIWYYDKNRQQISGSIDRAYSEQTDKVFEGLGWHVQTIDGHNHNEIRQAIEKAQANDSCPSLIIGKTIIGHGTATMEGSHKTHGAPLPKEERLASKEKLGLPLDQDFYWPSKSSQEFQNKFPDLRQKSSLWKEKLAEKKKTLPFKENFSAYFSPLEEKNLSELDWDLEKPEATRQSFGKIIAKWGEENPQIIGGSADLEPSNMTGQFAEVVGEFQSQNPKGRNLSFGVREFPMSALSNGLALYGAFLPFDATFLTFSDYSRAAIRLGALQNLPVLHELTHDSFYLGEDGPTHQPIEHIMSLRLIPDLYVMRPADPIETEVLMREALLKKRPTALCLSRQKVPYLPVSSKKIAEAKKGAWVVKNTENPDLIIFATGSEVALALETAKLLEEKSSSRYTHIKVVSMPCWELFLSQSKEWQDSILSSSCLARVSIEAASTLGWEKFIGLSGLAIGINHYGKSAPAKDLAKDFGFTKEAIYKKIQTHSF